MSDMVNHPPHYSDHPSGVECIEITRHMPFDTGNAFKYVWRAGKKGDPHTCLDKAQFYIRDAIANEQIEAGFGGFEQLRKALRNEPSKPRAEALGFLYQASIANTKFSREIALRLASDAIEALRVDLDVDNRAQPRKVQA